MVIGGAEEIDLSNVHGVVSRFREIGRNDGPQTFVDEELHA